MDPIAVGALGTAFAAVLGSYLTYRATTRAAAATAANDGKKVDAEAFERAQMIYQASIKELEAHIDRLEERCGQMETRLREKDEENRDLHAIVQGMRSEIRMLRAAISVQELAQTVDASLESRGHTGL